MSGHAAQDDHPVRLVAGGHAGDDARALAQGQLGEPRPQHQRVEGDPVDHPADRIAHRSSPRGAGR